jgi:hypothetical protein
MKTLATIVAMFLFASIASAQTQASMTANLAKVEQGKSIIFNVTVTPVANISGNVRIIAKSVSNGTEVGGAGHLEPDQHSVTFPIVIPVDASTGKWTVTRVAYQPIVGGQDKSLNVAVLPSFEVIEHKAVEPDSAVVEVK